jgi:glycosyltransferase involved in cell wall biosynthesis
VAGDAALTLGELEVESFASALQRLVSDSELRLDLRRRGLRRVRDFTWQRCAANTLSCYQRALDEVAP